MLDKLEVLWACGNNNNGCLGLGDDEARVAPAFISFFGNKRIIDFTCGDKFSVVIAEVYEMTPAEERQMLTTIE